MASIPPSPVCDLLHEQLTALLSDCETVMNNAAYGQTIHDLDNFLLIAGKKFIHEVLQKKLQEHIELAEKNSHRSRTHHH